MRHYFLFLSAIIVLLASCTRDREIDPIPIDTTATQDTVLISPGILKINEIVARGSDNPNEFGNNADWFEIFNTLDTAVTLKTGRWFVSDNLGSTEKYQLPEVTIPAYGFLVIWCDTLNTVVTQIHTNFGLSAGGEEIGLFYKVGSSHMVVDAYVYPAILYSGYSLGRSPDGADNWVYFPYPTPGDSNQ